MPKHTPELFHIWVTKWALTRGLEEYDAEITDSGLASVPGKTVKVSPEREYTFPSLQFYSSEWHLTLEGAVLRAEEIRGNLITELEKEIARLRAIQFLKKEGTPT